MKLILVRHGESEANIDNLFSGDDVKLTKKGIEQAKNAGKEIKEKYKIDMVFCSPLERCVETLNKILDECPIEALVFMSRLIVERDFGEYAGSDASLIDVEELNIDNKINREMGVESLVSLLKRVNLFLEDLKLENENSTILVVSHEWVIKTIIAKITGKKFDEITVDNGSIHEFEIRD